MFWLLSAKVRVVKMIRKLSCSDGLMTIYEKNIGFVVSILTNVFDNVMLHMIITCWCVL